MSEPTFEQLREKLEILYRTESGRILATLIRLLGDFDLAEDAMHDAFATALQRWPREGLPANPGAWLVSTGRFKAIDALRRRKRFDSANDEVLASLEAHDGDELTEDANSLEDDRLRLIFTCCHPLWHRKPALL